MHLKAAGFIPGSVNLGSPQRSSSISQTLPMPDSEDKKRPNRSQSLIKIKTPGPKRLNDLQPMPMDLARNTLTNFSGNGSRLDDGLISAQDRPLTSKRPNLPEI